VGVSGSTGEGAPEDFTTYIQRARGQVSVAEPPVGILNRRGAGPATHPGPVALCMKVE